MWGLLGSHYLVTLNLAMLGEDSQVPAEQPSLLILEEQKEPQRGDSIAQNRTEGH